MAATKYTISAAGSIGPFLAFRWDNPSLRPYFQVAASGTSGVTWSAATTLLLQVKADHADAAWQTIRTIGIGDDKFWTIDEPGGYLWRLTTGTFTAGDALIVYVDGGM